MELNEYREQLINDAKTTSEIEMIDEVTAYLKVTTEMLVESEETDDFSSCYFESQYKQNRKMQIDGYYISELDNIYNVFICNYSYSNNIETMNQKQIDTSYNLMRNFVEGSVDGYIRSNSEESSEGYYLATQIEEKINSITRFKFYILTDMQLSNKVKAVKKEPIFNIPVEINIWDINRIFELGKSKIGKESIEIDLLNFSENGLPSVLAVEELDSNYQSYLSVIPGSILADIYIEFGARLLEGNVRSFLSVRGKVNKSIRNTILNEPSMFFAYNNGISATVTDLETHIKNNQLYIKKVKDFQIINGGQTTASIANAVLSDKRDVSNVFIPVKISKVDPEDAERLIPIISRSANSQNKIDEADFFSNHPYHIRIEELSRKIMAPAINGNIHQTVWFYERARGQHLQAQMKFTKSQRDKFLLKHPKNQIIKKVDLAKYIITHAMKPHEVSKGAQSNMRYFAKQIDSAWNKSEHDFNSEYYKTLIAIAILFKTTERLVSNQDWYKITKSYRANIVTYSIAVLLHVIREQYPQKEINYKKIWNSQDIPAVILEQLVVTSKEINAFITDKSRLTQNVTEWCKKEICWDRAQKRQWTLNESFINSLIDKNEGKNEKIDAKKDQRFTTQLNEEIKVINKGADFWKRVFQWGVGNKLLSPIENDVLKVAYSFEISGKTPTLKQSKILLELEKRLIEEGMPPSI